MPKPFLTYDQQIEKLTAKHLIISDEAYARDKLHRYGYFALITGYKNLLKNPTTKNYCDGTTFEDIVAIYKFDERLRELTLRYLLHIERHIRSMLSYAFCKEYGESQSAYLSMKNYDISSKVKATEVGKLINNYLEKLVNKPTQYAYIEHHKHCHNNVPLWVIANALSFGTISKMYEYSNPKIQSAVSIEFEGVNEPQLRMLLEVLTDFRNVCAHNERLFTHKCVRHDIPDLLLHKKLAITKNGTQYIYGKRDYFSIVLAFRYLLRQKEFLEFKSQLSKLIDKVVADNKQIAMPKLLDIMGFPANWKKVTTYKKI